VAAACAEMPDSAARAQRHKRAVAGRTGIKGQAWHS
jgi:hypothetical protein